METFLRWLHRYVSPVFLVMLVASFILWYIAKLSYTYTTEYVVSINTDGEKYKVACIFADELLGEQQIVVKPLPNYVNGFGVKNYGITGCSILGDGSISIILDVVNVYTAAHNAF